MKSQVPRSQLLESLQEALPEAQQSDFSEEPLKQLRACLPRLPQDCVRFCGADGVRKTLRVAGGHGACAAGR